MFDIHGHVYTNSSKSLSGLPCHSPRLSCYDFIEKTRSGIPSGFHRFMWNPLHETSTRSNTTSVILTMSNCTVTLRQTLKRFKYSHMDISHWWIQGEVSFSVQFLSFWCSFRQKSYQIRMHSSRMRTTRGSSRRGCLPQCMLGYTPPPQVWAWRPPGCDRQTCKNITFANFVCGL